jgi:hypothetical protein
MWDLSVVEDFNNWNDRSIPRIVKSGAKPRLLAGDPRDQVLDF